MNNSAGNPIYPTFASKWRRVATHRALTSAETREYGQTVLASIRALQKREALKGCDLSVRVASDCASGYTNGL